MTNDEAIYVLKNTAWLGWDKQKEKVTEAVRMAVEALKTQLPKEDTTSDCISRQAAIRWVKTECNPYGKPTLDFESGKRVMEHLKTMPSVHPTYTDAEVQKMQDMEQAQLDKAFELGKESAKAEIIHCGECKHWREGTAFSFCDKLHGMGVLDALDYMTAEDDYCSMAERRTDERSN